jgi:hypothetical protein
MSRADRERWFPPSVGAIGSVESCLAVSLLGRYMLASRHEFPCQAVHISPDGMALIAPVSGRESEGVVAYVDQIGRVTGVIAQIFDNGFVVRFTATARKREKLAARLAQLAARDIQDRPEKRNG